MTRCYDRHPAIRQALWWIAAPIALVTCAENQAVPPAPSPNEVLAEMSSRSAVTEAELSQWLMKCDADQQAMYFCAFRDFITIDIQLNRTAAEQIRRHPECRNEIERELRDLKQQRDSACAKSAEEDYGTGSMAQTARTICASSSTKPLIAKLAAMDQCPRGQR
jgi:lysozyme inhibitor LprI